METPSAPALVRSKLFVPGSRPELFAKALASAADAISVDLEDAVAPTRKVEARGLVAGFLRSAEVAGSDKTMIVRVNAPDTDLFAEDLEAILGAGLDAVNLPMIGSAKALVAAIAVIERIEQARDLRPTGILVNIETPAALRRVDEIATAHPRVSGLQVGYGDLFEPAGIARDNEAALDHVRLRIRFAAAEAGIPCYDGALAAVSDPERYRREAEAARRQGYAGKSCIHPTQIALANAVFVPDAAEIARARRIVDAARAQIGRGTGAFLVDGDMIDAPFIASAQAILDLAARLGLDAG